MPMSRSTPFLYWSLEMNTMLIWSGLPDFAISLSLMLGSGVNFCESTAFGIVKVLLGSYFALKTKLSLQAWLTQMAASRSRKDHVISLLIWMPDRSLKPNRECSVNTVFSPYDLAASITQCWRTLVLWWPWTISICSRMRISRTNGSELKNERNATSPYSTGKCGRWYTFIPLAMYLTPHLLS